MKKMKQMAGFFTIPVIAIGLIIYIMLHEPVQDGITRAAAARAVALAVCSPEEFEEWRSNGWASHYGAEVENEWYVNYMDYMYSKGYFQAADIPVSKETAEELITYGNVEKLAEVIDPSLKKKVHATRTNRDRPMPGDRWWKFYDALRKITDPETDIHEEELVLYGTPANLAEAEPWVASTDKGNWSFDGISLDAYMNQKLTVLARGNQMIRLISAESEVIFENVWIEDGSEDGLNIYIGGIPRTLSFEKKVKKTEKLLRNMADLKLSGGKITKVSLKKERISGKLLSIRDESLEIEGYGVVPVAEASQFLKVYGTFQSLKKSDLMIGADNLEYVVAEGEIAAVLAVRDVNEEHIRVLIMNDRFKDICHEQITLTGDAPLLLTQGEKEEQIPAGESLILVRNDARLQKGRLIVTPQEGHEITVSSITRTDGTPSYGGRLEVLETENGLVLINEILFEDYLKKVVPSEMPGSFELEALKAQAVCARTYAYVQMHSNRYSQYGAQLDDSTNFQVYNNVLPEERTSRAVEETYGKLITCQGKPISAYYFSTSCGNTTDGSVWDMDTEDAPYLKSVALQSSRKTYDWSDEEEFRKYIKRSDVKAYDSGSAYFRWSMTTTADRLSETFDGIGTVRSIRISRRGAGGVALEMVVRGTDGERVVAGQNSIRAALCDPALELKRNDGNVVSGFSMLPSAFLIVEPNGRTTEGIQKFTIYGGGNGHGAGMSQNGAQGMAKEGKKYEEILKFFYEGIEIKDWNEHE